MLSSEFIKKIQREDCLKYKEFDLKYNVNTSAPTRQIVDNQIEQTAPWFEDNSEYFEGSTHYQPTATYWLDLVNDYFAEIAFEYSFVDIGSGKGKPIIYNIVNSTGYKEYIGVEIDKVLSNIFESNIKSINANNAFSVNIDALDYDYTKDKCIYFFAKPFEKPIFDKLMTKIKSDIIKRNCYFVFVFEQDLDVNSIDWLEQVYNQVPISIYKPKGI